MNAIEEEIIIKFEDLKDEFSELARVEQLFHDLKFLRLIYAFSLHHLPIVNMVDLILELLQTESFERVRVLYGRNRDILVLPRLFDIKALLIVAFSDVFEAAKLQIHPRLDVWTSKQESLDETWVVVFEQTSVHQVNEQDAVLVIPLEVSGISLHLLHRFLVPLAYLVLREALAVVFFNVLLVHISERGRGVGLGVVKGQLMLTDEEEGEHDGVRVSFFAGGRVNFGENLVFTHRTFPTIDLLDHPAFNLSLESSIVEFLWM